MDSVSVALVPVGTTVGDNVNQQSLPKDAINDSLSVEGSIPYPAGCDPIDLSLTKEDLVRRLRKLAKSLQELKQDTEEKYTELARFLAKPVFFNHSSKDVRLLIACCMADLFRMHAPDDPFENHELLRDIFLFLTSQLAGLAHVESPLFNRHFYLLENLAWVKSFNICLDLPTEMNQTVFCQLFRLIFRLVSDQQQPRIRMFMMDMLCPLILESDFVSTELMSILLTQLLPSVKPLPNQRVAYQLAKVIVEKTGHALQPFVVKAAQFYLRSEDALSDLGADSTDVLVAEEVKTFFTRFYDIVYELTQIFPDILVPVLPEFAARLQHPWNNKIRLETTQLLCRLFNWKPEVASTDESASVSTTSMPSLISRLPTLWAALLKRFEDSHSPIRFAVIQMTSHVFLNYPQHVDDVVGPLRECGRDVEESIRFHVVQVIRHGHNGHFFMV